jgi:hypothetical protein
MNSFRFTNRTINPRGVHTGAERRLRAHAGGYHARWGVRELLTAVILCAAIFGAAFALGRDAATPSAPAEGSQWTVPVVSAGPAIPARLATAPPVQVHVPIPVRHRASAPARTGAAPAATAPAATAPAAAPLVVPAAPAAPVAPEPTAAPTPAAPPAPQPPAQPARPSGGGGTGTRAPESGSSFETSG